MFVGLFVYHKENMNTEKCAAIIQRLDVDPEVKKVSNTYMLSNGVVFRVDDYRTVADNDEAYYAKTKSLDLRRGVAAVYNAGKLVFLLSGLPKFGYVNDVFTPPSSVPCAKRVYTMKENGEAGHLAFFPFAELSGKPVQWYAIVGSKNVHIVLSLTHFADDLNVYKGVEGSRLDYAIANAQLLQKCNPKTISCNGDDDDDDDIEFKESLYKNNQTIVFEAIYNNHIIEYDKEKVIAFAITQPIYTSVEEEGLAMPPEEALRLLSMNGFNIPEFDVADAEDVDEIKRLDEKYEKMENSEGAVVYEVAVGGFVGVVVTKIYKHKNHMYIVKRMVRELIKRQASYLGWVQRFEDIHFDAKYLEAEIKKLLAFYVWVMTTASQCKNLTWADNMQIAFKGLLKEFESNATEEEIERFCGKAPVVLRGGSNTEDHAILLVGIQGSGKTTMRNELVKAFGRESCTYVNQDELGGKRKAFILALKKNKGKIMIVDKCNHLRRLRDDVYNAYENVHIIEMVHPEGMDAMRGLSLERIRGRGLAHPNLIYSVHTSDILGRCAGAFEAVCDIEKKMSSYVALNPLDGVAENVQKVLEHLWSHGVPKKEEAEGEVEVDVNVKEDMLVMKNVRYWQAGAKTEEVLRVLGNIELPDGLRVKNEFHMTMYYDKVLELKRAKELVREPDICVHIDALVYNDKCAALLIRKTDFVAGICDKDLPHITVALAEGVAGVYSNEMLAGGGSVRVDMDCDLKLIISPVMKK
jgi:hypothetical protein